jgi:hypothetical protein
MLRHASLKDFREELIGKNWTLQSLLDSKMCVTAFCHNQSKALPLEKLRDGSGPIPRRRNGIWDRS